MLNKISLLFFPLFLIFTVSTKTFSAERESYEETLYGNELLIKISNQYVINSEEFNQILENKKIKLTLEFFNIYNNKNKRDAESISSNPKEFNLSEECINSLADIDPSNKRIVVYTNIFSVFRGSSNNDIYTFNNYLGVKESNKDESVKIDACPIPINY